LQIARAVQQALPHKHSLRGDFMENKYDATYQIGKTVVHVVAPKNVCEDERKKRLRDFHLAGWSIWNSLPREKQLEINNEEKTAGAS